MQRAPWYHYPLAVLAVLWALLNVADYLLTKLQVAPYLSYFTLEQIAYFTALPLYVDLAWAVAVWGGLLAALYLWKRSHAAAFLYALSFLGICVTSLGLIFFTPPGLVEVTGAVGLYAMIGACVVNAVFYLYARAVNVAQRGG